MTVDEILRGAAADLRADVDATVDAAAALDRVVAGRRPAPSRRPLLAVAAVLLVAVVVAAAVVALARDDGDDVASEPPPTTTVPAPTTPGPPAGESAGVPMTVAPATGLEDGDRVEVTADGLPPDLQAGFVLCRADALLAEVGMDRCQFGPEREMAPDATGHLAGSVTAERLLTVGRDQGPVDCAREVRCAVGVVVLIPEEPPAGEEGTEVVRFELRGLVAVELVPQEPLAAPTVRVTPAEGLRHAQVVTITGEGFADPVNGASLCIAGGSPGSGDGCTAVDLADPEAPRPPGVDRSGHFEVEVPVWRLVPLAGPGGQPGWADCAEVACTLTVPSGDGRVAAPVPLAFDPDPAPPEVPTVRVSPTDGVRPGDPVTVTVEGLAEGQRAAVSACAVDPEVPGRCSASTLLEIVEGGADGTASVTIPAVDPAAYGLDCTGAGRCAVDVGTISPVGDPLLAVIEPVPIRYAP